MTPSSKFTDMQARRLKSLLAAPGRPEGTMTYPELAGFLFAVVCCPDDVAPSEWLDMAFGGHSPSFSSQKEAEEGIQLIMSLYQSINAGVLAGSPEMPSGCKPSSNVMSNMGPDASFGQWAGGFAAGHSWLADSWLDGEADDDEEEDDEDAMGVSTMALSFFASENLALAYCNEVGRKPEALAEMAADMLGLLPMAMQNYAFVGRSRSRG